MYRLKLMILGIETSCDDTGLAICNQHGNIVAAQRFSQLEHIQYGGVVPEIAARNHEKKIIELFRELLKKARIKPSRLKTIAFTAGPGLQSSLLIGANFAKTLGLFLNIPILPIHHIFGHMVSIFLERKESEISFPALCLTVSGGHTQMILWHSLWNAEIIGETRDDAAGEAFDKCAIMLGLHYPGGPKISKLAKKGDINAVNFPRIFLEKDSLDFSFSGLKSAMFRFLENNKTEKKENICASFQHCVAEIFVKKVYRAIQKYPKIRDIHFVGGVSANSYIQHSLQHLATEYGRSFLSPKQISFSTDNAEMISKAGFFVARENPNFSDELFKCNPRWKLKNFLEMICKK